MGLIWFRQEQIAHRWQVECPRYGHKKINANKLKNAVSTLFGGNQAVAFA